MKWTILAVLRFFLAWIVMFAHISDFVPYRDYLIRFDIFGSHAAVLGFLLISGYSIAHSISKKPEGFYRRRLVRIYPLYLSAIIFSLIPFWLTRQDIKSYTLSPITDLIGNLFFLQGFLVNTLTSNPVLWTLSVEVACYLLAPFFIKLGKEKLLILIAISSFLYAASPYIIPNVGMTSSLYGLSFVMLLWAWLLGFVFFLYDQKRWLKILIISLGCFLLIAKGIQPRIIVEGGRFFFEEARPGKFSIFTYTFSALVLIYSSYLIVPKQLINPCRYLGELSYPLYLFHTPVVIFSYAFLGLENSVAFTALSLLFSAIFYHAVDRPIRHLQRKS